VIHQGATFAVLAVGVLLGRMILARIAVWFRLNERRSDRRLSRIMRCPRLRPDCPRCAQAVADYRARCERPLEYRRQVDDAREATAWRAVEARRWALAAGGEPVEYVVNALRRIREWVRGPEGADLVLHRRDTAGPFAQTLELPPAYARAVDRLETGPGCPDLYTAIAELCEPLTATRTATPAPSLSYATRSRTAPDTSLVGSSTQPVHLYTRRP
jgi:hypothetical protein